VNEINPDCLLRHLRQRQTSQRVNANELRTKEFPGPRDHADSESRMLCWGNKGAEFIGNKRTYIHAHRHSTLYISIDLLLSLSVKQSVNL